ncbi:hypothetical protein CC86DRAFT_113294 [Ophiobolus disseminans]|uniref:Uncharacterized protein n=1 Tax=Ophiobolus disseminans TaxID=1469910 RepID=A0A6A6ZIJ0_9PLEO|nr:hypothetical protein CC86DRAFT_113294 [Ophiobolus disseminans]
MRPDAHACESRELATYRLSTTQQRGDLKLTRSCLWHLGRCCRRRLSNSILCQACVRFRTTPSPHALPSKTNSIPVLHMSQRDMHSQLDRSALGVQNTAPSPHSLQGTHGMVKTVTKAGGGSYPICRLASGPLTTPRADRIRSRMLLREPSQSEAAPARSICDRP